MDIKFTVLTVSTFCEKSIFVKCPLFLKHPLFPKYPLFMKKNMKRVGCVGVKNEIGKSCCICLDISCYKFESRRWFWKFNVGIWPIQHASFDSKSSRSYIRACFFNDRFNSQFDPHPDKPRDLYLALWMRLWWVIN